MKAFPSYLTPFVGRDGELRALIEYINNPACRLLTLTGPGGIGKTRLAIELGVKVSRDFEHGSAFVDLQAIETVKGLLPAITDALRLPKSGQAKPERTLFDYLQCRQTLLILDNFEHLVDGAEHVLELLRAAPQAKVIVTSREALNLREEWLFPVAGLHFPSADVVNGSGEYASVRFFVNAAQQIVPGFRHDENAQAVMHICRLVEGMPLALELAASWLTTLSCAQIADEISHNLDILSTRMRNIPERHHSIRAVFEQTYQLLTAQERAVVRRMAVFRGKASREAAEQVAGATLAILSSLIDKSLLKQEPDGRYRMHELIRQFANEELARSADETRCARAAHAAYYMEFLQHWEHAILWGEQKQAHAAISRELDNVRAAWQWAVENNQADLIRSAATALFRFYQMQSRYHEAVHVFGTAAQRLSLDLPDKRSAPTLILLHCYHAGFLIRLGDLTKSEWSYRQAQAIYERFAIPPVSGIGTDPGIMLAIVAIVRGQHEQALQRVQQRYAVNKRHNHTYNVLYAHHISASVALGLGDYERAHAHARQGVALANSSGDRWFTTYLHIQLAIAALGLQDYETARQHGESSYTIAREFDNPEGMARARLVLGEIGLLEQAYAQAAEMYAEALAVHHEISDRGGQVRALNGMALAAIAQGDLRTARDRLRHALQIAAEVQYVQLMLFTLSNIAELLICTGQHDDSARLLDIVSHHPATIEDVRERAQALRAEYDFRDAEDADIQADSLASVVADLLLVFPEIPGEDKPVSEPVPKFRQSLVEPLTEREQEVLFLVAEGLKNREIAERLFVTLGTVKSHVNSIYGKLDVRNRVEAVARARELSLL